MKDWSDKQIVTHSRLVRELHSLGADSGMALILHSALRASAQITGRVSEALTRQII